MTANVILALQAMQNLPCNEEYEQALIGALLNDSKKLDQIADFFGEEYFYNPLHAKTYSLIEELLDRGESANPLAVKRFLEQEEVFKTADMTAWEYLVKLTANAQLMTAASFKDVALAVKELAARREVIRIAERLAERARVMDINVDFDDVVLDAELELQKLDTQKKRVREAYLKLPPSASSGYALLRHPEYVQDYLI